MEYLLAGFPRFCRFSREAFCRKSLISMGRNDLLKPGKLGNLIRHIGKKTRQFSVLWLYIQGAAFFQTPALLLTHPVASNSRSRIKEPRFSLAA